MFDPEFAPPRTTFRPDTPFDADREEMIAAVRAILADMSLLAEWLEVEPYPTIAFHAIHYLAILRREACELTPVLTRH